MGPPQPSDLDDYKKALNSVGWFIPPYLMLGLLGGLKDAVNSDRLSNQALQGLLEGVLAFAYSPSHLAAMVRGRYPITPFIQEYSEIIGEAIKTHFLGLGHVAVSGLLPVVEGAGRKLSESRSLRSKDIKILFTRLAKDCKREVVQNNIGAVGEIISMIDSFAEFTNKYLYAQSADYRLSDNTNRHGTLHGAYTDGDYGRPISFYKIIGPVDFLCMVSAIRARPPISLMAPPETESSKRLSAYYAVCASLGRLGSSIEAQVQ
jgi:hypothetical protein